MRPIRFLVSTWILVAVVGLQVARADDLKLFCFECATGNGSYAAGPAPLTYNLPDIGGMTWGAPTTGYLIFGVGSFQTGDLIYSGSDGWHFGGGGSFNL